MNDYYNWAVSRMLYWRRAQTTVLCLLIMGVPLLYFLEVEWELHLPVYAGALAAYLFCERNRSRYRGLAREIHEGRM